MRRCTCTERFSTRGLSVLLVKLYYRERQKTHDTSEVLLNVGGRDVAVVLQQGPDPVAVCRQVFLVALEAFLHFCRLVCHVFVFTFVFDVGEVELDDLNLRL